MDYCGGGGGGKGYVGPPLKLLGGGGGGWPPAPPLPTPMMYYINNQPTSSIFKAKIRKTPDIPKADSKTDQSEYKLYVASPVGSL